MKLNIIGKSFGTTVSVAAIAALTLAGCGSDNNAPSGSSESGSASASAADCGGKNAVTAEGSTAQQNAIALFNHLGGGKLLEFLVPGFRVLPTTAGEAMCIALALGVVAGLFPAVMAARIPLVRALRRVG